ncbi:DEAD/DEAH box helicase [Streptomyces lycii]|uniref:DEAD/DEAH box helicase n=1 Tax=Streptomyces lycii TaxID=2654337 RepID=A0ABQ7FJL8_9ACTN|nr:DEAD/DEAH box helicase [Streptomyces lycii]KAF4408569.1 DEAD/DEAH box helicase [Streptomyces lycii]
MIEDLESRGRSRSRKSVEWITAAVENETGRLRSKLPEDELAEFLVDRSGFGLLESRTLRERLALSASEDELETLHDYRGAERSRGGSRAKAKKIAERTWKPGKSWPRHFARVLDIPPAFAGLPGSTREPDTLEVAPFVPLRDLEDFQQDLKEQVIEVLSGAPGANRGVLTLPTGAGKTRTAVESLIEWRLSQPRRQTVLWIAQSEELCEQAVQAFREVWTDLGHRNDQVRHTMEIARLWGSASVPSDPDIVVASIQKLDAVLQGTNDDTQQELELLRENLGAVVVDEAHRMLAPSYSRVLRFLGIELGQKAPVPVIGLTATPFRRVDAETRQLAERFHSKLLSSRSLGDDIVSELRRQDVLSRPEHKVLSYAGPGFRMDDVESHRAHFDQFKDFHPDFLRKIGESDARNRALLEQLLELPPDCPTLFFGCTVEHSIAMAVLLRRAGRAAEVVTSDTRSATRRALIEQFRNKRLSVLCNYGVLTTGFDAPAVRALVVGRPTTSPVLYEQMIGRGMRGQRFGGTKSCLVVDIEDNIRFSGQLAYERYSDYWSSNLSRT